MEGNQQQQQTPPGDGGANQNQQQQQQQQTPPAGGGNQQAQQQQQNQQTPGEEPAWFKKRWAEKMGDIEKELGLQPGGLKDFVASQKKNQQRQAAAQGEVLGGADLRLAKMEALLAAGVPGKQVPIILQYFNIPGKTREAIEADIQNLISGGLLKIEEAGTGQQQQQTGGNQQQQQQQGQGQQQNQNQGAAQGAGQNGVPGNGGGPKIWTKSEVLALQKNNPAEYDKHRMEILQQMSQGLIK